MRKHKKNNKFRRKSGNAASKACRKEIKFMTVLQTIFYILSSIKLVFEIVSSLLKAIY